MSRTLQVVGSVLVRNEDLFVGTAIRNAAGFCDRIHVLDHASDDETPRVLAELAAELDHVDVVRSSDARESHRVLERYAGTRTWVLGVDGDELFDPVALARLRGLLEAGAFDGAFRVRGHVLNADSLDEASGVASGWLAPPSRPVTKLFNMAGVDAWPGSTERLHGGTPRFRPGFELTAIRDLADEAGWDEDPLRMLHLCFLRRSSTEPPGGGERPNLAESGAVRRSPVATLARRLRPYRPAAEAADVAREGSSWKRAKYARGTRVTLDVRPFLGAGAQPTA